MDIANWRRNEHWFSTISLGFLPLLGARLLATAASEANADPLTANQF
jgi:hypothetical protein